MSKQRNIGRAALMALALGAAQPTPAAAQADSGSAAEGRERCYGVALKGENEGIGAQANPGTSMRDYQGDAWTWVPQGVCMIMPLPAQTNGTPRRGAPVPLERDRV